ncbi:3144_t:CDS:1, partial [Cetraspora pellucida]
VLTSSALPTLCRHCAVDLSNTFSNKLLGLTLYMLPLILIVVILFVNWFGAAVAVIEFFITCKSVI